MIQDAKGNRVKYAVGAIFAGFLILNVVLLTMQAVYSLKDIEPPSILPQDFSIAGRVIIFMIGLFLSWLIARQLYSLMLKGQIHIGESANTSVIMLSYLALTFATLVFVGILSWFWLPFLLLMLLIFTGIAMWRSLGAVVTILVVLAAIAISATTAFLTNFLLRGGSNA
jgi:hypothetical protein